MTGKNLSLLDIPPGIVRNSTRYATGNRWFNGNQVRWSNNLLVPVGGWSKRHTFTGTTKSIRKLFSWRDNLKQPWVAAGCADQLYGLAYDEILATYTEYVITPVGLATNPGSLLGYGRDFYGSGFYGVDAVSVPSTYNGSWSMDNFGKLLVAVHSQDGRLVSWNPDTPSTVAQVVGTAPNDNTLVIVTDEENCMLLGGINNPRRVKWCARRDLNDWTPTEINDAGGFDLKANGAIVAACKVQGGILVLTDSEVHLIEYIGPPNYYSRRKISEEGGIVGKNALIGWQGGATWVSESNAWSYFGGAVQRLPCDVHAELFKNSNMTDPDNTHIGVNEAAQELWIMYPDASQTEPNRYAAMSYEQGVHWSLGIIPRSAWLNPVWQTSPLAANNQDLYEHEFGMLADGVSRASEIYVETGALELEEGDFNTRVDRLYPDFGQDSPGEPGDPNAINLTFYLQQAPRAPVRTMGPFSLANPKGFITLRFRARQMYFKISQLNDNFWKLGKFRLRVKAGGKR